MRRVQPDQDLFFELVSVNSPARYVGGEFGTVTACDFAESPEQRPGRAVTNGPVVSPGSGSPELVVAVCFPDLYEIGMSNTAIKLLYDMLNRLEGVRCERVFLPAPDFEAVLRRTATPLYTLESGIALHDCDVIAFSIGYELSATNVLTVLDVGGIPLHSDDRTEGDPLVIAGGPGVSANPLPLGRFLDGVFIGEAEAGFPRLAAELSCVKRSSVKRSSGDGAGGHRSAALAVLHGHPHVWFRGRMTPVTRAIWNEFGQHATCMHVPVPNMKIIQDQGVVEIMRGCPQGCRFCSAGVYYRPYRMKSADAIIAEVEHLVDVCGYRTVSLSSLSSGDYREIEQLFRILNDRFADRGVSFALPSLRVNSLTLPILEQVSRVRKSGLTFAVETASEAGQHAMNKLVPVERIIEVLREARERGWRVAKFYFMIGLPIPDGDEAEQIIAFFQQIRAAVKMNYNLAIATFIPKPHTPFQWSPQMTEEQSVETIRRVKAGLKPLGVKVGYQAPFQSTLEGVLSRGGDEVGELVEKAFRRGCRLDAWEEHLRRDVWRELLEEDGCHLKQLAEGMPTDAALPWAAVRSGVSANALLREFERSQRGELTEQCAPECADHCGVCNRKTHVREIVPETPPAPPPARLPEARRGAVTPAGTELTYVQLSFTKTGPAAFLSHLALMSLFERSLMRADIPVQFSSGFNPKPLLEFAQPLSLGIESDQEICALYLHNNVYKRVHAETLLQHLNAALPAGIRITAASVQPYRQGAEKPRSLMSRFWGADYRIWGETLPLWRTALEEQFAASELVSSQHWMDDPLSVQFRLQARSGAGVVKFLTAALGDRHPFDRGLRVRRLQTLAAMAAPTATAETGENGRPSPDAPGPFLTTAAALRPS